MNIITSKHSRKSALALSEALGNCSVYNPYQREYYRGSSLDQHKQLCEHHLSSSHFSETSIYVPCGSFELFLNEECNRS